MDTYTFYIEDDRYSVPTLLFVTAANEGGAPRLARQKLGERHHLGVEVWQDERLLFKLIPPDDQGTDAASAVTTATG